MSNDASPPPELDVPPRAEIEPEEMPLPGDPKTVFLGALTIMAALACAYVAREILLPIVLALVLKLLLQPLMCALARVRVPWLVRGRADGVKLAVACAQPSERNRSDVELRHERE